MWEWMAVRNSTTRPSEIIESSTRTEDFVERLFDVLELLVNVSGVLKDVVDFLLFDTTHYDSWMNERVTDLVVCFSHR